MSGMDLAAAGRRGWDGVPLAERLREQAGHGAERDGQPTCDALKKSTDTEHVVLRVCARGGSTIRYLRENGVIWGGSVM